ncbi:MAG TPA: hypothetical protein VFW99_04160, partial [Candidatus Nitrosotalea sp.]|nr:hypothetical protein [Candidatus Nitrosotalea sp.]
YSNAWTLFYILSLYLIQKRQWHMSIISYILSILSKALTLIFLPMTLFFIYSASIPRKTKIVNVAGFVTVLLALITTLTTVFHYRIISGIHPAEFWTGFTAFGIFLRSDGLVLIFLLPLIGGLFIMSKRGVIHANSIMILIFGVLFSNPLLVGLTDFTNQPYRLMPLIVFFAMGVGVLLSKRVNVPNHKGKLPMVIFLTTSSLVIINLIPIIFPSLIKGTYRLVLNG